MATVAGTLKLNDKMSPALKSVVTAINSTLRAMKGMDVASSTAFRSAKRDAALASAAVDDFAKSFDEVSAKSKQSEKSLGDMITKAISLGAVMYGIRKTFDMVGSITAISDSMQRSVSRINLINDGMRTTLEYQDMIFASANRARSSYLETADAVSSLGLNARDAFASTDEIVAFSELMNKSFKISGADAQAQAGAMRQLTQALASGVLRGDEFNSIAEQAPLVYDAIAKYMKKSKGEVRSLAADGALTADIVRKAMFAASADIERQFALIPPTFSDAMTQMKNDALLAFRPVLTKISELTQSERFARFTQDVSNFFYMAAEHAMNFIDVIARVGAFVQDNGDMILICIGAICTALFILKAEAIAAGIASAIAWLMAAGPLLLAMGILAALIIAYQNTTGVLQILIAVVSVMVAIFTIWIAVTWLLNTAMAANPIGAIIMLIVILIGWIVAIISCIIDLWKTNMDFKYGVLNIWDAILFFFKGVPVFFQKVGYGIADAFSWAKVTVLTILESMANGAIDIINNLIEKLTTIPGVAIDPINQLSFAATVAAEETAKKQSRAKTLADSEAVLAAEKEATKARRASERAADQAALDAKAAEKNKSGAEKQADDGFDYSQFGKGNLGDINRVGKVGKIEDDVTISDEDIKMLKDIASMDYQLHYTQLTPSLTANFGDIRETADAGKLLEFIETSLEESLSSSLLVGVSR